ncbi:ABC transporter permease [Oenococcus alcoholitolerans]|uniref:ABC transporter permease n=1 Tax=Oenococcus alcoholitolerans TaxID=931074 RepID=A0ABR4XS78_9LACO|nr:ABC transporter permease [Oenococcus alcoholitolerans]
MSNQKNKVAVALISVLFGLLAGGIIMTAFGYNPFSGYGSLFSSAFGNRQNIGEIFSQMTPLILTGLSFLVASQAGFFNIGMSGQMYGSWVGSVWFTLYFHDLPNAVLIIGAIIFGILLGAAAGFIPGFLRARFGASEVIITIMMNYIILYLGNAFITSGFPHSLKQSSDSTIQIGNKGSLSMHWLSELTNQSSVSSGIFIALIVTVIIWFISKKTTFGFAIDAVGKNADAARYAGINDKGIQIAAMTLSGALSGLAGVTEGLGHYGNAFVQNSTPITGFNGMAVALLGSGSFIGVVLAAALFSTLTVGGSGMPNISGVPTELVSIVIALMIFFVGASYLIQIIIKKVREADQNSSQGGNKGNKKASKGVKA